MLVHERLQDQHSWSIERFLSVKIVTKVTLVALSTFAFLNLQFSFPPYLAWKACLVTSSTTYICEILFQDQRKSVFWPKLSYKVSSFALGFLTLQVLNLTKTLLLFGQGGSLPLQEVSKKILSLDYIVMAKSLILAPLAEEIVFRGFLEETLFHALSASTSIFMPIATDLLQKIATVAQAVLFGMMHITFGQVKDLTHKISVFLDTTFMALVTSTIKQSTLSLVPCVIYHALSNVNATLSLF